ncbi:DUF4232 domain-containing protein [Agromyces aurantiacus]|uniref:DUF4232 domain-containing protein n=1 Tax=Agromyces aurantiacus TaxID=165814 RepID=A0ABV9R620_9MICO|nr:DUF4232 domain-containing protein [Agromyces aurantiacus]MBM7504084.1 hypothetical protein [Agromyces aurantiacus]
MHTKRVVFRAVAGVAVTAALTGGTAMVAGAVGFERTHASHASAARAAAGDAVTVAMTGPSSVATTADAGDGAESTPTAELRDRARVIGPAHCEDSQLTMEYREQPDRSTAEAIAFELVFTNTGSQPCSFDGWPGLVAEDADGGFLTGAYASGPTSTLAVLPPSGGQAVAEGEAVLPSSIGCVEAMSHHLRAYISSDGAGGGIVADARVPVCADGTWSLLLGPLVALHGAPGEVVPPEEPEPLPAKCQDEQLSLEYAARPDLSVDGASGFELVFTNESDVSCSVWGWPGLVVESADGSRIGWSTVVGEMGEPFVLANGDAAIVLGTAPEPAASGCDAVTADHLRAYVTSDGAGPGVVGAAPIPVCADGSTVLEIGPFTAA